MYRLNDRWDRALLLMKMKFLERKKKVRFFEIEEKSSILPKIKCNKIHFYFSRDEKCKQREKGFRINKGQTKSEIFTFVQRC